MNSSVKQSRYDVRGPQASPLPRGVPPPIGTSGASRPVQPDAIARTVAGSSTESCRVFRSFLTSRVNLIRFARPPIEDDDSGEGLRDGAGHPRRFVHSRECRRCGDAGMCRHVEPYRRHHVGSQLRGFRGCGPTPTGRLSGHAATLLTRFARPGASAPGLALFRPHAARHSRIYATPRALDCR
jgi:hypothetical protein